MRTAMQRERRLNQPAKECDLCGGALVVDPAATETWLRRLFDAHPDWTARRVKQRAAIETLKAPRP